MFSTVKQFKEDGINQEPVASNYLELPVPSKDLLKAKLKGSRASSKSSKNLLSTKTEQSPEFVKRDLPKRRASGSNAKAIPPMTKKATYTLL